MFALPVQPPMLYIKMCVFKFSLRFRVAALEIWCTTSRKFEKTCFKVYESCIAVLFSLGMSIIKQQSSNSYAMFYMYSKIVFESTKLTILIKILFQTWNKIMTLDVMTKNITNPPEIFSPRATPLTTFIFYK